MSKTESCDMCGSSFSSTEQMEDHFETKTHKKNVKEARFRQEHGVEESPYYVYCVSISPIGHRGDYYYVGRTANLLDRISDHRAVGDTNTGNEKRFPVKNGKSTELLRYETNSVESVEACANKDESIIRERELMLEVAQEYNTVDVLGGR